MLVERASCLSGPRAVKHHSQFCGSAGVTQHSVMGSHCPSGIDVQFAATSGQTLIAIQLNLAVTTQLGDGRCIFLRLFAGECARRNPRTLAPLASVAEELWGAPLAPKTFERALTVVLQWSTGSSCLPFRSPSHRIRDSTSAPSSTSMGSAEVKFGSASSMPLRCGQSHVTTSAPFAYAVRRGRIIADTDTAVSFHRRIIFTDTRPFAMPVWWPPTPKTAIEAFCRVRCSFCANLSVTIITSDSWSIRARTHSNFPNLSATRMRAVARRTDILCCIALCATTTDFDAHESLADLRQASCSDV